MTFNELGWIPFYEEAKISKCCILYRRIKNNVPDYLINTLTLNSQFHSRENRYSNLNYICPNYNRVTEGGRTFNVTAVKLWNSLSIDLKKNQIFTRLKMQCLRKLLKIRNLSHILTSRWLGLD